MKLHRIVLSGRGLIAASFLVLCIVFGGGGSPSPFPELVVQSAGLLCVFAFANTAPKSRCNPTDRPLLYGVLAFLVLILLQLVPLPPAIWHNLPGREAELASLALVNAESAWRPLSVSPYRTLASLLSLIPPIALIYMTSRLDLNDRTKLLGALGGIIIIAAIVGVIQMASGNANWLRFYRVTQYGFATGFQANRNAQADVLLTGAIALCAFVTLRRDLVQTWMHRIAFGAIIGFLVISLILAGSRAGIALAPVVAIIVLVGLLPRTAWRLRRRTAIIGGCAVLAVLGAGILSQQNKALSHVWQRFSQRADGRFDLWPDSVYAIKQYWPAGSGVGTFVPVFRAAERLEVVDRSTPNRAHDDYLEFALEGGAPAIVLLAAAMAMLIWRIIRILGTSPSRRRYIHAVFATGTLSVFALHSLVDYPMRSMSLAAICGFAIGMLSTVADKNARHRSPTSRPSGRTADI